MKATRFIFYTALLYLLGVSTLAAQDTSIITGKVFSQKAEAVPYANVALIAISDGHLVSGAVSNELGEFRISSEESTKVKLVISSIGYTSFESEVFELHNDLNRDFASIQIQDEMTGLDEVTIQSTRPEIIIEPDKTVINVEGTVMAEGSNALDVIGRSPGIYIDQDGVINLNGRSGVVVMINDRQTYMSALDLANFLRAMPADNIKSIEVINNPSARFDAEGSAGVINLKLKKNTVEGVFGNVQIGGTYNGLWTPSTGLALNVKKGKWSSTINLNYSQFAEINEIGINRNFATTEGFSRFEQHSEISQRKKNIFLNGATNYEINEKHNVSFNFQASTRKDATQNPATTSIYTPGIAELSYLDSYNDESGGGQRYFANLHYGGDLDTLGTKLTADLDFTRMNSDSESLLSNTSWTGEDYQNGIMSQILTLNDMYYTIFTSKVDFVKPLWKGTLETGVKGSWVKSDNNLDLTESLEEGPFLPTENSNNFIYHENVLAAYASYKGKINDKLAYQAGLRGEYSSINGNSVTLNEVNKQHYFNLFPSAFLQQTINENYQIIYNANRRITRPNYRLLNPYVYYVDPLTTERGNPNLKPQYSNNFEMNHVVHGAYQFALGYSVTEDAFMQVFMQDDEERTTTTFTDNFDNTKNLNFRAIVPIDIAQWYSTSNMVQVNYNKYKSLIGDDLLDNEQVSFLVRTQHNMNLPKGFKIELVGMYLGPQIWGQGMVEGFGWVDLGITKTIMQEKLTIALNGTDIFKTQVVNATINFADIDTSIRQYRSTQGVRLTLRYNFSRGESFKVKSNSGSVEERNRLN